MKHEEQLNVLKELIRQIDSNTTCDAGRMLLNPTSSYTDKELAQREWETMFQGHPQVIGLSPELPKPGSYMTNNDLGVPILATRDKKGKFHAFVNACRHRGAQLTDESRGEKSRFTCPFHAWTYSADGKLMGVRQTEMFGEIDKSCHSLIELPSQEKYGFLVIHPQVDGKVDIDELNVILSDDNPLEDIAFDCISDTQAQIQFAIDNEPEFELEGNFDGIDLSEKDKG